MIYTVKKGDSLGVIASRHNTTIEVLMRLNPEIVDKDRIYIDQQIKIRENEYVVQPNDSLYKIGQKLGVNWKEIAVVNNIKEPYIIYPKDKLIITGEGPVPPQIETRVHKIERKDTLWDLAKKYNTTVAELEKLNPGVKARALQIGSSLNIPSEGSAGVDIVKFYLDQGYRLTSDYGYRTHPITGVKNSFHGGIDFGGKPNGYPITMPVDGEVVYAQWFNGWGYLVGVRCKRGLTHLIGHMSKIDVKIGDKVIAGKTVIGGVGATGNATGPHIHYQINKVGNGVRGDGYWDNPRKY